MYCKETNLLSLSLMEKKQLTTQTKAIFDILFPLQYKPEFIVIVAFGSGLSSRLICTGALSFSKENLVIFIYLFIYLSI